MKNTSASVEIEVDGDQSACVHAKMPSLYYTHHGHKLRLFTLREAQFVTEGIIKAMRATRYGEDAVIIGEVTAEPRGRVLLKTPLSSTRIVDMLADEMLPRICSIPISK